MSKQRIEKHNSKTMRRKSESEKNCLSYEVTVLTIDVLSIVFVSLFILSPNTREWIKTETIFHSFCHTHKKCTSYCYQTLCSLKSAFQWPHTLPSSKHFVAFYFEMDYNFNSTRFFLCLHQTNISTDIHIFTSDGKTTHALSKWRNCMVTILKNHHIYVIIDWSDATKRTLFHLYTSIRFIYCTSL